MENTPFIKLFSSPRNKYVYDVGKNEIIKISDQLFNNLHLMETGTVSWQSIINNPSDELQSLITDGYLSGLHPSVIKHPFTDYCSIFLNRKIDTLTLQVTQECNFRCKYCIYSEERNNRQRSHSHRSMSWETAKAAIDFYFEHSVDSQNRNVGFYGGEPLLNFELIKMIVDYAKARSIGKSIGFSMTTNGSLLSEQVVSFLEANEIRILVSVDGNKEVHDSNRVFKNGTATYDFIIENLKQMQENHKAFFEKLAINTVLNPTVNIDDVLKIQSVLTGIPINNYHFEFVEDMERGFEPTPAFHTKMVYQEFLAFLSLNGLYPKERLSFIASNAADGYIDKEHKFISAPGMAFSTAPGGPCIPGKTRLFVNVDGDFFPCEKVNEVEHMCIGNLKDGFNLNRVNMILNVGALTAESCKECWAFRLCNICARQCDDGKSLSSEMKQKYCSTSRKIATQLIRTLILMNEMRYCYNTDLSEARCEYCDSLRLLSCNS